MGDDSTFIKIGPVGNVYGKLWDEKGHNKIAQIFISHDDDDVESIQFQYVKNGTMKLSTRLGHNNGNNFDVVKLNYPSEYITSISGTCSTYLCSITFGTNKGKYGPFGQRGGSGEKFKLKVGESRQFGGFHGTTNGSVISSIGVYLKPKMTLDYKVNKNSVKLEINK